MATLASHLSRHCPPPSTVGRGRQIRRQEVPLSKTFSHEGLTLCCGDALDFYPQWASPQTIISDGGYGILGFEGDTSDHLSLPDWYEPHIKAWSNATPLAASLWFWNSEIGWAAVHPVLEKYGWRYVNCNVWNKGKAHIAGNVNTSRIRRFPVVTEICVQYTKEIQINGMSLKSWLLHEWKRTGLSLREANLACGVRDAAVRKYLDQGHLWYFPPPEVFAKMAEYANIRGCENGRPYFSVDGVHPLDSDSWKGFRSKFYCPHGVTNVWDRNPLKGKERMKAASGKAAHLNQKPLDLMEVIIRASTDESDVVWEPFGGLFTASAAAFGLKRKVYGAEIDPAYFEMGVERIRNGGANLALV